MSDQIVLGKELGKRICEKLGLKRVRRLVIDIPYDGVVTVYVEQLGTTALLNIDMQSDGIKIKEVEPTSEEKEALEEQQHCGDGKPWHD